MAAMAFAMSVAPFGGTDSSLAGTIAVAILMVIAAIVFTVVEMMAFFRAVFHCADRIAGIRLPLALMVAMGGNRDNQKGGEHKASHSCHKRFFETHIYRTPFSIRIVYHGKGRDAIRCLVYWHMRKK